MLLIGLILFSTCFYVILGTILIKRKNPYETRIKKFLPSVSEISENKKNEKRKSKRPNENFVWLFTFLKNKRFVLKWNSKLVESGFHWKPEEFFAVRFGLLFVGVLLGVIFEQSVLVTIILALLGFFLPVVYVQKKKKERIAKGAAQLPQALGTMATAMKAGFSFIQAMQLVGKEIPDPLGMEFVNTVKQINLGVSMEEAFQNMLKRFPNKDLEMVVTALLIQRSTGGNLAELLENMQITITERIKMKEELNALTSQGKMSAWVISLLPVGLGLLLKVMNPEYFSPLLQHPLGIAMLVMGAVSGSIGWVIIRKIVNVEV